MADNKSGAQGREPSRRPKGIAAGSNARTAYIKTAANSGDQVPRAGRVQHAAAKPAQDSLREAGASAAELAQNPLARSLLAAGLVTAAAALAANKNVRATVKRGARRAQDAAEAAADEAMESANEIGAAMISAATEAVRRMMGEAIPADAIETSEGSGLGELLSPEEGLARLTTYAGYRPIESWAGKVAGPGKLQATLGIPRSTLNDWRRRGAVIGLLRGQRKHVYPLEQFVDARPLAGIGAVSEAVGDSREAWLWLRQPHGRFDMKTPLRALGEGQIDRVVEAAGRDFR